MGNRNQLPYKGEAEAFGKCGKFIELSGDHNKTMQIKEDEAKSDPVPQSVFGSKWFGSTGFISVQYMLAIKQQKGTIGIGLINTDRSNITKNWFSRLQADKGIVYGLFSDGRNARIITNQPRPESKNQNEETKENEQQDINGYEETIPWAFKQGDKLLVTLTGHPLYVKINSNKKAWIQSSKITFKLLTIEGDDDTVKEVKFNNILTGKDCDYKLVVSAQEPGDSVTIEECKEAK